MYKWYQTAQRTTFHQINFTYFLNEILWYQIRCLHDQIRLKQTNQISFE